MSFQGKTIALIASWNLQCILNARWNFSLSWSCISNKKFQRVKATVSKRIYPKCGVREKRISHQFFRFNFIISLGTINLTYFRHVWNLNLYVYIYIYIYIYSLFLQKPLHKENIERGLKELTNIDRHGSTTFQLGNDQSDGISYSFDIIVYVHHWEIKFRKANERNVEPK